MKDLGRCRAGEAFGVGCSGDGKGGRPVGGLGCYQVVVHVGRAVQSDAGVPVLMVVPLDKIAQERLRRIAGLVAAGVNLAGVAMVLDLEDANARLQADLDATDNF